MNSLLGFCFNELSLLLRHPSRTPHTENFYIQWIRLATRMVVPSTIGPRASTSLLHAMFIQIVHQAPIQNEDARILHNCLCNLVMTHAEENFSHLLLIFRIQAPRDQMYYTLSTHTGFSSADAQRLQVPESLNNPTRKPDVQ